MGAKIKSGRRDSNSRPPPWQGDVLPLNYFRIFQSRSLSDLIYVTVLSSQCQLQICRRGYKKVPFEFFSSKDTFLSITLLTRTINKHIYYSFVFQTLALLATVLELVPNKSLLQPIVVGRNRTVFRQLPVPVP